MLICLITKVGNLMITILLPSGIPKHSKFKKKKGHMVVLEDRSQFSSVILNLCLEVIYEFCFELISQYEVIGELMVDYNADTYHMGDKNSIKIPDSLLKINDVQEIYKSSYKLT